MNSESLDPDTAPSNQSIWKAIDRAALERHTQALFAKKHVAGRRFYAEPSYAEDDRSYPLPLDVEKSLADDFAFIAACQPQVGFVSAAAIEQNGSNRSFVVKLAANEGVSPDVKRKFHELFEVLRKHARNDITREDCQGQLFELILQLNCNKILGRLGSTRFQPPMHLAKTREPLPARLRQLFRNNIQSSLPDRNRQDVDRLDGQIGSFEATFRQLENGNSEEIIPNIGRAIKQAFDLTENGSNLPNRLKRLDCPDSLLDTRDVREVGKVSNYWRISRHLAICSQRFRSHFANAEWYPLLNYRASSTSRVLSRQYIHAEIQLLVHFELTCPHLMPRVIGVSKEACFLCDSFIRAHGRFSVTGAHRQMFPQWTIPDLKEYNLQTVQRFRQVLSQIYVEVNEEYLKAQKKLPWRPYPLQSAVNLNVMHLNTPSTSTLPPQPEGHLSYDARTIKSNNSTLISIPGLAKECVTLLEHDGDGDASREAISPVSLVDKLQAPINDREGALAERPIDIIVEEVVSEHRGWVHTFASFSSSPIVELQKSQRPRFIGGSVSLESSFGGECQRIFHLADIPSDEELILERDSNDALNELSFFLVGTQEQKVRIRCRWHIS